jgi:hypothetical protein
LHENEEIPKGENLFIVSINQSPHGLMAFITDEELVGKAFYDEESGLSLILPEHIYGGKLVDSNTAKTIMRKVDIHVLTGKAIIELAVSIGLVNPRAVLEVKGIPHAHVYKIQV